MAKALRGRINIQNDFTGKYPNAIESLVVKDMEYNDLQRNYAFKIESYQYLKEIIIHDFNFSICNGFLGNYSNSGFDRSSFLKTDNSNEFSSSCTTRIVPILTTGVSFLRSYKVSNKRPIMGHPRSDLGQPRSVSGWTGSVSSQPKCG